MICWNQYGQDMAGLGGYKQPVRRIIMLENKILNLNSSKLFSNKWCQNIPLSVKSHTSQKPNIFARFFWQFLLLSSNTSDTEGPLFIVILPYFTFRHCCSSIVKLKINSERINGNKIKSRVTYGNINKPYVDQDDETRPQMYANSITASRPDRQTDSWN